MRTLRQPVSSTGRGVRGFALITAMAFVFLMSLVAAGVLALGQQQLFAARRTRDFLKARVIAEAGANAAYNNVRTNYSRIVNFTGQPVNYDDGVYRVGITTNRVQGVVGNDCAVLVSTGTCGIAKALVGMSLRNFGRQTALGVPQVNSMILSNAVTSGGALTLTGGATINGSAGSMVKITVKGSSDITGTAYAPVISGTSPAVNDPARYTFDANTLIDYAAYKAASVAWDGHTDFASYPAGTIVFCDVGTGNVTVNNSGSTIRCCIISTGGFYLTAHPVLVQTGGYPALISLNGDIDMHGGADVTGVIIAKSASATTKNTGGGGTETNISGAFITAGVYDGGGNWDINFTPVSLTYAPAKTTSSDGVVPMAFQ